MSEGLQQLDYNGNLLIMPSFVTLTRKSDPVVVVVLWIDTAKALNYIKVHTSIKKPSIKRAFQLKMIKCGLRSPKT